MKVTKRQLESLLKECEFQLRRIAAKMVVQPKNFYYTQSHRAFLLIQRIIQALYEGQPIEVTNDGKGGDDDAR